MYTWCMFPVSNCVADLTGVSDQDGGPKPLLKVAFVLYQAHTEVLAIHSACIRLFNQRPDSHTDVDIVSFRCSSLIIYDASPY
jgi:hypothetical protein